MKTVIFACVHNAGRSQMAAGFFNTPSRATPASDPFRTVDRTVYPGNRRPRTGLPVAWRRRLGPGGQYGRLYDAKTVEMISGEVTAVEQMTPFKDMAGGVHLTLKTDKESISVHLGRAWYTERQDTKIAAGDKLEVKGSRITYEGKPAIIAAEIHKGDFPRAGSSPVLGTMASIVLLLREPPRCRRSSTSGGQSMRHSGSKARGAASSIRRVGVDNVMFETDFPHPICLYRHPLDQVRECLAGLTTEERRQVLRTNAARAYNIPLD